MTENSENYESDENKEMSPEIQAGIASHLDTILNLSGSEEGEYIISLMTIEPELTYAPEEVLPTLKITKPRKEYAEEHKWAYSLSYGVQDPSWSKNVLIGKIARESTIEGYNSGEGRRALSQAEGQQILKDVTAAADKLRSIS